MKRPIIGITCNSDGVELDKSYQFYRDSIDKAGGDPCQIFYSDDTGNVAEHLAAIDGLLFSGGDDLDPALWGETWHPKAIPVKPLRQRYELALLTEAERLAKPVLGICLGCQLLNVHRGGSLQQFLPDVPRPSALEHRKVGDVVPRHVVNLEIDSMLGSAIGRPVITTNSYHKQAIDRIGRGLRVVARASDGVIEAIEDDEMPLFVGVQWHPERTINEPEALAVFRLLVSVSEACRKR